MKYNWGNAGQNRGPEQHTEARFRRKSREIKLRNRIDIVLLRTAAVFVLFLVGGWFLGIETGFRQGIFDPPPLRPLTDQRLLVNIRDDIIDKPLLDSVFHPPEESIYISQAGGKLHRYYPRTGLWRRETIELADHLLNPDIFLLRSGSGADARSQRPGSDPDLDSLWGITGGGGLVHGRRGNWRVLVGDSFFSGARGMPVSAKQLTTAAVSGDGRWLVVGTRRDGAGIYDLKTRQWLNLEPRFYDALPAPQVTHLAFCRDHFWIGGPGGLASLRIAGKSPQLTHFPGFSGQIRDLDVDGENRLWVLEKRKNKQGGAGLLRISRIASGEAAPPPSNSLGGRTGKNIESRKKTAANSQGLIKRLIDEKNIYPGLKFEDLHFAYYFAAPGGTDGGFLILAGDAGLFVYDAALHSWQRLFERPVLSALAQPKRKKLFFGYDGGIGVLGMPPLGAPRLLPVVEQRMTRLKLGKPGEVLALSGSGRFYALRRNKVIDSFAAHRRRVDPAEWQGALTFGDTVLFTGKTNSLVHNIVSRDYKKVASADLPDWLTRTRPSPKSLTSGSMTYITSEADGSTDVFAIDTEAAAASRFDEGVNKGSLPGTVTLRRDWQGQGMVLRGGSGDGQIFRFSPWKETLTGAHVPEMSGIPFYDAAPFEQGVMAATYSGLRHYDYRRRAWRSYKNVPIVSGYPAELANAAGQLFIRTSRGSLTVLRAGDNFFTVIKEKRFDFSDEQLSDVMEADGRLFLAGPGRVYRYDQDLRSIIDSWRIAGSGAVKLAGLVGSQPLALCRGKAYIGSDALDPGAGEVLNLSVGPDYVWTVRGAAAPATHLYLKAYPVNNPFSGTGARCFFRNPGAGAGIDSILDAVELPGREVIAVSTPKGLRFYSPRSRSWYSSKHSGGELYVVGEHLLIAGLNKDNRFDLTAVKPAALRLPGAGYTSTFVSRGKRGAAGPDPFTAPVTFNRALSFPAVQYAVNKSAGKLAYITPGGGVVEWRSADESRRELLAAPGEQPVSANLRRLFYRDTAFGKYLLCTTTGNIRRYDLDKRTWQKISLDIPEISDISISRQGDRDMAVVKNGGGEFFICDFDRSRAAVYPDRTPTKQVFRPGAAFGSPAESLMDVQQRGLSLWTFVLKDRIKYFSPLTRKWVEVRLEGISGEPSFCKLQNRGIIKANNGRSYWVAVKPGPHPRQFARYDLKAGETTAVDGSGSTWKLTPGGKLFKQPLSKKGVYFEESILFEQPFLLAPGRVQGAYRWQDLILFDTTEGMRALDTVRYREAQLPGAARDFGAIVEARREGGLLRLRNRAGRLLLLEQKREGYDVLMTVRRETGAGAFDGKNGAGETPQPGAIEDTWPALKSRVVRLPDGSSAYNPLTRLRVNSSGELLAEGHSRAKRLAPSGTVAVDMLPPALNVGWLQWQRENRSFRVETHAGPKVLSRLDFIKNDKLIFEEVDALMVDFKAGDAAGPARNRFIAANSHGTWTYTNDNLSLDDRGIRFRPLGWQRPLSAAHGYFITPGAVYTKDGQPLPAGREHRVRFGDVTLIERIALSRVRGLIAAHSSSGTVTIDAFAAQGFAWDRNKRGLAYTQNGLLIQSDAGIHPVDSYAGFEKPPGQGQLYSEDKGVVYFYIPANFSVNAAQRLNKSFAGVQGAVFQKRPLPAGGKKKQIAGLWKPLVGSPWANRTLVDNDTWQWQLKNGRISIRLKGKAHNFRVISGNSGLSFSSDRLVDAAVYKNRLFVKSEAFLEIADLVSGLGHLKAQRLAVSPFQGLKVIRRAGGRRDLTARQGGSYFTWNETGSRFQPAAAADDPRKPRVIAQLPQNSPLLRFTLRSGAVQKELLLTGSSGSNWVPFRFSDRRFPFDVVTSIAARGDTLYVGTKAGLQVYSAPGQFLGLNSMSKFYGLRGRGGALQEIKKVGIPLNSPDVVMAYSPARGIEILPDGSIKNIAKPTASNRWLRLQTGFWRWYTEKEDRLFVQYKDRRGNFSPASSAIISKGLMLHDHIVDIAAFDDRAFTLWRGGWLSIYPGLDIEVNDRIINQDQQARSPRRFVVFYEDTAGENAAIPRGLYLQGKGTQVWQYRGSGEPGKEITWVPVTEPALAAAVAAHGSDSLIVNRRRLRLKPRGPGNRGVFTFEQRGLDGRWRPLAWKDGQVGIDKWSEFLFLEGRLWAATAAGLTSFSRTPAGRAVIDPDSLMVIREPQVQGQIPEVTDMAFEAAGGSVVVRCRADSKQAYRGILDGQRDSGVFTPLSGEAADPFANKLLVAQKESGFWEWKRVKCRDYHPGVLEGKLRGEKILLSGGRFSFDTINSLAFLEEAAAPPLQDVQTAGEKEAGSPVNKSLREAQKGMQVEIACDAGGYYRAAASDLHAAHFYRPQMPGVNPAHIREVRVNRQGGKKILGLKTDGGDFIHWGANGVSGRTAQFSQYLCEDGFWRYEQDEPGLSITVSRGAGRGTQRRLENGRFSDDVVVGLPVCARDNEGVYYLLPTKAGVLRFDRKFKPAGIYPVDTLESAGKRAPNALFAAGIDTERTLIYGAKDNFYLLEQPGVVYPGLSPQLPPGAELLAVEDGPQDFVRLRWQKGEERGWSLLKYREEGEGKEYRTPNSESRISKGDQGSANPGQRTTDTDPRSKENAAVYLYNKNDIFVNISEFRKYNYYKMKMSAAEGWLQIHITPTHLEASSYQTGAAAGGKTYRLNFPDSIRLLNPIVKGETLYLTGERRLWEVNLDYVMRRCFEGAAPPAD